ncbi:MAG: UDP-glucose 6-dehydrogenase [Rhodospirillaceae bacterium]|nr:UDP-glucose 6-dehydrogenase [Rhodospirillaceae bacterium]|tara:strand:+ start:20 stop:1342 length:1323 start_codon:yes stop_codon:yes gene_type:complete
MQITMVGTGYVGLVSGVCFSEFGLEVICVDKNHSRVEQLKQGQVPIYEPGLDDLVRSNIGSGRLKFTQDLEMAFANSVATFIAVGTPSRRGDGHADLSYVYTAAKEMAPYLPNGVVVVTKSTVPVGTGDQIEETIATARPDLKPGIGFDVVSNPEFLREGSAIEDFMRPDRIVVGAASERARSVLRQLYRPLFLRDTPFLFTDRRTAELTKYAANAFLATKITFINEMANLCEATGANVQDVAKGMGLDGRIGSKFLHAGPGYGGSCFPKDTEALVQMGRDFNAMPKIVDTVALVNSERPEQMAKKVIEACEGNVSGRKIAVLGLTFKPNTDDMRDAPSIGIISFLQNAGAQIYAYDPAGMAGAKKILQNISWGDSAYSVIKGASALVIATEWNEFRALDLERLKCLMKDPIIVDLRNIYRPVEMEDAGIKYVSVGRPDN